MFIKFGDPCDPIGHNSKTCNLFLVLGFYLLKNKLNKPYKEALKSGLGKVNARCYSSLKNCVEIKSVFKTLGR